MNVHTPPSQIAQKLLAWGANCYLFLAASYTLVGSLYLINILVDLTMRDTEGFYFIVFSAAVDRYFVYALAFIILSIYLIIMPSRRIHSLLSILVLVPVLTIFQLAFILSEVLVDALMVTVASLTLACLVISPNPFPTMKRKHVVTLFVTYLLFLMTALEFSSLFFWLIFPVAPSLYESSVGRHLVDLETQLFLFPGSAAPVLTTLLLFSWAAKPLWTRFLRKSRNLTKNQQKSSFFRAESPFPGNSSVSRVARLSFCLLLLSVILAFSAALYPYIPSLNLESHWVGVDIPYYAAWIRTITDTNSLLLVPNDRPLVLVLMYLTAKVGNLSPLVVAKFSPLVLAPALPLALYFFMRQIGSRPFLASLTAVFSVSSFHLTVGMYAGCLAMWMAIIELYLFIGFFFRFSRDGCWSAFMLSVLLSILMLLTHSSVWGMAMGVLTVYLSFLVFHRKDTRKSSAAIRMLFLILVVNLLASLFRNVAFGIQITHFEMGEEAYRNLSLFSLLTFWDTTRYTFLGIMAGFFLNPLMLFFAAVGGVVVSLQKHRLENQYLISLLIASLIPFLFSVGWNIKYRILYSLPIPVFAVMGLNMFLGLIQQHLNSKSSRTLQTLLVIFVVLINLNYTFRSAFILSELTFDPLTST